MARKRTSDREGLRIEEDRNRRLRRTDVESEAEDAEDLLRKEGRIKK